MKPTLLKLFLIIVAVIVIVAGVTFAGIQSGRKSLVSEVEEEAPVIEQAEEVTVKEKKKWQDGWVKLDGEIYEYNKNILTFLIMGTDQHGVNTAQSGGLDGGQADVLSLLVLDPDKKRIEFIPINRNTMVDVDVYDASGNITKSVKAQIAVQHGVGNGMEESCEYQVKTVSNLFYQLPIHGYVAMNMEGVVPLSKAVGGVDVTLPNDFDAGNKKYKAGETVHLEGADVMTFVRERDHEVGGADRRLERQKVYMKALISQMIKQIKENPVSVTSIFKAVSKYVTTDISTNEMVYLATLASGYRYDGKSMHTIQGETVKGEQFDEFYCDEDALKKLVIEVFYEKVEE
ncbi:LCP family protein [Butyrivibrio sp. YAB3001]|uniref:LCP family protein n=1 Tax=Butyrivibrio sp. YAB3001 TaxID=1520812 RepID=UPI000B864599|nr:LCP family protein [Butyrivibrio sp. YAB3001]